MNSLSILGSSKWYCSFLSSYIQLHKYVMTSIILSIKAHILSSTIQPLIKNIGLDAIVETDIEKCHMYLGYNEELACILVLPLKHILSCFSFLVCIIGAVKDILVGPWPYILELLLPLVSLLNSVNVQMLDPT